MQSQTQSEERSLVIEAAKRELTVWAWLCEEAIIELSRTKDRTAPSTRRRWEFGLLVYMVRRQRLCRHVY